MTLTGDITERIYQPLSTVRNQEYGITWGNVIPSDRALNEFEDGDPVINLLSLKKATDPLSLHQGL